MRGISVGLELQGLFNEWSLETCIWKIHSESVWRGDSQARQSVGRMTHVQDRCLLVQKKVPDGHVTILAVRGKNGPADMFTKAVSGQVLSNVDVPISTSTCAT